MSVREIFPDELLARAEHFQAEFERAAAYSNGTLSVDALFSSVMTGRAALFDLDGGIVVIDTISSDFGLLVRIAAVTGDDMQRWISDVDRVALAIAEKLHARGVIAVGRPGWKREAARHGYAATHTVFLKEIHHA